MRLNPFAPTDNPLYESLYCFGGGDDPGGDAGDVESGKQGMGPAASGPQTSLGAKSNVADYSRDDSDRRVQSTGSTTNFNIDRSQPSVSTDKGRVYGTQENLDKAVASGDLDITPSAIDSYTPGTPEAQSAFTSAGGILSQDRSGQAAAGPALADTNIFTPTAITGGFSPVTRAMSPFEMTLADSLGPRPDFVSNVRMGNFDDPEVQRTMAELDQISAQMGGDPYGPSPQQTMSPVDRISIFEDFEQPLDANNPPTALDPSRPMTQFIQMPATPAEQITQEARAAANQLFGADRTRPTAAEVAAADQRLTSRTPGLQAAINEGIMPANVAGQYGMQPTTTEVDAYNAAINAQIADQLGIASYSPGTFNPMKEAQNIALAGGYNVTGMPGADISGLTRPSDFSDIEAMDRADQNITDAVNKATREVALETGVSPQQAAQATGIASINQMYDEVMRDSRLENQARQNLEGQADYNARLGLEGAAEPQTRTQEQMALTGSPTFDVRTAAPGPSTTVGLEGAAETQTRSPEEMALTGSPTFDARITGEDQGRQAARDAFARGESEAALMAEVEREAAERQAPQFLDSTAERAVIEGKDPRAPDYTLEDARANFDAARAEAYADKQFGFDTGLPESMNIFGARVPTGVGVVEGIADAVFNPEASVANAIAQYGIKGDPEGGRLEVTQVNGRTVAYDPQTNIVYDTNPYQLQDIPDEIREVYARKNRIDDEQRQFQGDGGDSIPPLFPVEETPEETPEEYQGKDVIKPYQYQPRGPLSFAYTGLPSLAPTRLRPSYQAPKTFSPLFPVS